ncbi:hypothetical protein EON64_04540 [archaeon]|nr:MAG: hypothetical protein EON64_04540 [archaeon]
MSTLCSQGKKRNELRRISSGTIFNANYVKLCPSGASHIVPSTLSRVLRCSAQASSSPSLQSSLALRTMGAKRDIGGV